MSVEAERETADRILEFADAQLGRLDKHAHLAALEAVLSEMLTWREAILSGEIPKKRGRRGNKTPFWGVFFAST